MVCNITAEQGHQVHHHQLMHFCRWEAVTSDRTPEKAARNQEADICGRRGQTLARTHNAEGRRTGWYREESIDHRRDDPISVSWHEAMRETTGSRGERWQTLARTHNAEGRRTGWYREESIDRRRNDPFSVSWHEAMTRQPQHKPPQTRHATRQAEHTSNE